MQGESNPTYAPLPKELAEKISELVSSYAKLECRNGIPLVEDGEAEEICDKLARNTGMAMTTESNGTEGKMRIYDCTDDVPTSVAAVVDRVEKNKENICGVSVQVGGTKFMSHTGRYVVNKANKIKIPKRQINKYDVSDKRTVIVQKEGEAMVYVRTDRDEIDVAGAQRIITILYKNDEQVFQNGSRRCR